MKPKIRINKDGSVSWARFASLLAYKAERAGRIIIEVNPRDTSIDKEQSLSDRTYNCKACGFVIDRDHNAALLALNNARPVSEETIQTAIKRIHNNKGKR